MKVLFQGNYEALEPIHQTRPAMDKKKGTLTEQNRITLIKRDETGQPIRVSLPVVNIRGMLRDFLADEVSSAVGREKLDFNTISLLFTGGVFEKAQNNGEDGKEEKDEQKEEQEKENKKKPKPKKKPVNISLEREKFLSEAELMRNNIVVSLFGGSVGNTMLSGKTRVSYLIPSESCRELRLIEVLDRAKMDDFVRNHELRKTISPDAMFEYFLNKADQNSRAISIVVSLEYIPAGVTFDHSIEILNAEEAEIGAILSVLKRFSTAPYVGACRAIGFGRVNFEYKVIIDGREVGFTGFQDKTGFVMQSHEDGFLERALQKYEEYLKSLTLEKITVPQVLVKTLEVSNEG